jgi:hypothetical protein
MFHALWVRAHVERFRDGMDEVVPMKAALSWRPENDLQRRTENVSAVSAPAAAAAASAAASKNH